MPAPTSTDSNGGLPVHQHPKVLDYSTALEVLDAQYPEGDGIDVRTLLNSQRNGGLTYNDFLILPGHIGTQATLSLTR